MTLKEGELLKVIESINGCDWISIIEGEKKKYRNDCFGLWLHLKSGTIFLGQLQLQTSKRNWASWRFEEHKKNKPNKNKRREKPNPTWPILFLRARKPKGINWESKYSQAEKVSEISWKWLSNLYKASIVGLLWTHFI